MSLRISRISGQVKLTLPNFVPEREAAAFIAERAQWIDKHLGTIPTVTPLEIGQSVLFKGQNLVISKGSGRRVTVSEDQIFVPGSSDMVGPRIKAFLKLSAKHELIQATQKYADMLAVNFGRVTIRDTRSRWGSCSSQGNLNYSWRLMMTPPSVLDYVAAHEVCHLIEMNHSQDFWDLVDRICPSYRMHKKWLKDHGDKVHSYRFD